MKKAGIISSFKSLFRLLGRLGKYKAPYFISGLLESLGMLGFNAAFSYGMMFTFRGLEEGSFEGTRFGIIVFFASLLGLIIVGYLGHRFFHTVVAKISGQLRKDVFTHVCRLPVSWFEGRHSGDTLSRLTNDIQAAETAWGQQLVWPVSGVVSGIGSAVIMLTIHWPMALVFIAVGVGMLFVNTRFLAPVKKRSDQVQQGLSDTTQRFVDILASSRVARVFNLSAYLVEKLQGASKQVYKSEMGRTRWQAAQNAVNMIGSAMSFMGLLLVGGVFAVRGVLPFSKLIALVQMSSGLTQMFWILSSSLGALQQSLAGAERVIEVLDTPVEEMGGEGQANDDHAVVLDNVSFSYDEGVTILNVINECVKKGETLALVGGSGGGKSTILKLIMGFYQPDEGNITVSGQDRRSEIAYVPQTNYLFAGTVKENIAYGSEDAKEDDIVSAAKAAMAHDFIMALPDGYDTVVGERGSRLSGGQHQRIAIARAIIKNAPILLLDEATSSMDSESERLVQRAIDRLIEGRTSIIVAHRLSTIRHADRILVLEDGRVVEQGEHHELMKKDGRYAYYYNLQFDKEEKVS